MQQTDLPHLFGLSKTNRDFTCKETWGKNQFNSSFPAALCCYLDEKSLPANYLSIHNQTYCVQEITVEEIFGIHPTNPDIYFAFEAQHTPYQKYVIGQLPRTDLVIQKESTGECVTGLEIKLTALPDNTTCQLNDKQYGSEIVVRPDTIVYLACSIASKLFRELQPLLSNISIEDWSDAKQVLPHIHQIIESIIKVAFSLEEKQSAFLLHPIWKTVGKSPKLAEQCLDVFTWSDAGFAYFTAQIANRNQDAQKITRQTRSVIWLFKMLKDISEQGRFNHHTIIDELSYNTKNDKAFASAGNVTNPYMSCPRLVKPAIAKTEIKHIIKGGGQHLLSPERRFDAIIYNSPELFDK